MTQSTQTGGVDPEQIARGPFAMIDVMRATMAVNAKRTPTHDLRGSQQAQHGGLPTRDALDTPPTHAA